MSTNVNRFFKGVSGALLVMLLFFLASCTGVTTIPVDSISVSESAITLTEGETHELTALIAPTDATDPTITFSSSDNAVATVDADGLITAISEGVATITATAGSATATCVVTVEAPVVVETVNGFKPFEKGGLLGTEGGTYYPVTVTAVGTNAVRFSGKGGLSWPDTANNMVPDAMGGYYDTAVQIDGLKVLFKLDDPMEFSGDHWHFIALESEKQLFNAWNGSDPVQTFFVMIAYEGGKIKLQPHYRDVIGLGEGWSYLGKSQGVDGTTDTMVTIEFNMTDAGLTLYLNGVLQWFDTINSYYIPIIETLFGDDDVYLMAGAHIGNPGAQYEDEYAFTLGIDHSASTLKDVVSIAFTEATKTIMAGDTAELEVTVNPVDASNQNITYSTSNVNVATVNAEGVVTAIGEGSATITARVEGKSATCAITVIPSDVDATGIELDATTLTIEQFTTGQLTATVLPLNAGNKNVLWSILDADTNVTLTPDAVNRQIATVAGVYVGTVTVRATIGTFTATCEVTVTPGTLNGFSQFLPGGLVGGTTYDSDILMESCDAADDCVKFTGRGGTNWGDTNNPPSTMGGIYTKPVSFDNLEILYSVDSWIDGGTNHFYVIAISTAPAWFNNAAGTADTLYFMFAYNNGNVTLRAHNIGEEEGWTHIGVSQGVPAAGGQYSIKFLKVDGGYEVYMKNAGQTEYTLQNFEGVTVLSIAETYFGSVDDVYVMAGAYAETFTSPWSFTLGVNAGLATLNGFNQFLPGGLVNGTTYDGDILMESCDAGADCVKFTGRGGTNWGDTDNPPSTMGGYYTIPVSLNNLEVRYSVDSWIDGATNHFYVIAFSAAPAWFNNSAGTADTLFFMFAYNAGNVTLRAHNIGEGEGWTHIGVSQGVPAAGGQYSIKFVRVDGGYEVYMKNADQSAYTLQNFEGITVLSIAETYFGGDEDVYVMAGAYAETYASPWSFTLGVTPAPAMVNGFSQFLPGGLVGGTTYDSDILMESCDAAEACVKFTGRGGTNWGDTNNPPSTMGGLYATKVGFDNLEILYSVDSWIDGGTNHFYVIALSAAPAWFNNAAGTADTLFFMFAYNNGNVTLRAHNIGEEEGWSHIGVSQGVPAAGGQYSIKFVKVTGGYEVYMKNAGQAEYTLQNFEGVTVLAIAETYFGAIDGVYVMAGAYAETYTSPWSFTLGVKPAPAA